MDGAWGKLGGGVSQQEGPRKDVPRWDVVGEIDDVGARGLAENCALEGPGVVVLRAEVGSERYEGHGRGGVRDCRSCR